MFDYSIYFVTQERTRSCSHLPRALAILLACPVSPAPVPPAAAVVPTDRVLTRAVLESQEKMVRAIRSINYRLDQLISVLKHMGNQ